MKVYLVTYYSDLNDCKILHGIFTKKESAEGARRGLANFEKNNTATSMFEKITISCIELDTQICVSFGDL